MTTEIEAILRSELEEARAREASATEEYWRILADLTHDDPTPDELDQLCDASRLKTAARQALWEALSKLDEFRRCRVRRPRAGIRERMAEVSELENRFSEPPEFRHAAVARSACR